VATKSKAPIEDPFFDVADAAAYLGQQDRWLRRQVEEGNIRYAKMGLYLRFRKSWLDEYVAEHTVMPDGDA
jgi:excisionase family DNA binding protein